MSLINFKNVVWREGKYYVAWNLNTHVSSFGDSKKQALEALQEALELYLEDTTSSKRNRLSQEEMTHNCL